MKICVVVGTRPEIVKMAPIIHELKNRHLDFSLVHTGQHYDHDLSQVFFEELDLPPADVNLETGSGSQAEQTATALVRLESTFRKISPDLVLVEGDTNTVLAGALAAAKLDIDVGHVEAGLRSYDLRMPEEHNRRLTDHLSSYLFAPTQGAASTLEREACWGKIRVTGNTVIDACLLFGPKAEKSSSILKKIPFDQFALATTHRADNVDNPKTLQQFFEIFNKCPIPVVYPIHPRTRERYRSAGLESALGHSSNIALAQPLGYFDFITLLAKCSFVLTDSGGIQEEVTAPNILKKAFVLRNNTERPEAVEAGYAEVMGTNSVNVLNRLNEFLNEKWSPKTPGPFGDGFSASRIVDAIA